MFISTNPQLSRAEAMQTALFVNRLICGLLGGFGLMIAAVLALKVMITSRHGMALAVTVVLVFVIAAAYAALEIFVQRRYSKVAEQISKENAEDFKAFTERDVMHVYGVDSSKLSIITLFSYGPNVYRRYVEVMLKRLKEAPAAPLPKLAVDISPAAETDNVSTFRSVSGGN